MKLRNKQTGEIVENAYIRESHDFYNKRTIAVFVRDGNHPPERVSTGYETLAELNDEWEDYEETKEYWYLTGRGNVCCIEDIDNDFDRAHKEIGNYFDSEKEAKRAVEKLKAMAKLNEFGFRFIDWELDMKTVADGKIWFDVGINTEWDAERLLELKPEVKESLDILFGGEE